MLPVHGLQDRTVPFGDARRVQAACAEARLLPVAGGHDLREALVPQADKLIDFPTRAFDDRRAPHGTYA